MVRRDKSGGEAETGRKRRRNKYGLHTGSSGSTRKHDWVVGSQILTVSLFFTRVVTDDTTMKGGTLIRVESVTGQLTMCHVTDGMDEVMTVKVFKPILVRIMHVGATVKLMC